MFKRNQRKRRMLKFQNKCKSLMIALLRAYLKGKGGKAPYDIKTMKDIKRIAFISLEHMQRLQLSKEKDIATN